MKYALLKYMFGFSELYCTDLKDACFDGMYLSP